MIARMKKAGLLGAALLILAGLAFYFHYHNTARYFQQTNDATIQADQVAVSSKLAGYVRSVAVDDNQAVLQGAVLVQIDPLDYQTRLSAADADIASALAARDAAVTARAEAEAGIASAEAGLRAAQASLDLATQELARNRALVGDGIVSHAAISQMEASRERAAADVAAQRAGLVQARRRVDSAGAQTTQLEAKAVSARVQRQAASNDLAYTRITAPIAGRIAGKSVRQGQFVQPGTRLLTIVPSQDIYVVANFKETQVGLMRPGQPATIRVDALPDVEFRGVVTSVTPGTGANFSMIPPQNATGNFTKIVQRVPVKIRIDAGPASRKVLAPGLSLDVEVDTRAARDEIDAIRAEQEPRAK